MHIFDWRIIAAVGVAVIVVYFAFINPDSGQAKKPKQKPQENAKTQQQLDEEAELAKKKEEQEREQQKQQQQQQSSAEATVKKCVLVKDSNGVAPKLIDVKPDDATFQNALSFSVAGGIAALVPMKEGGGQQKPSEVMLKDYDEFYRRFGKWLQFPNGNRLVAGENGVLWMDQARIARKTQWSGAAGKIGLEIETKVNRFNFVAFHSGGAVAKQLESARFPGEDGGLSELVEIFFIGDKGAAAGLDDFLMFVQFGGPGGKVQTATRANPITAYDGTFFRGLYIPAQGGGSKLVQWNGVFCLLKPDVKAGKSSITERAVQDICKSEKNGMTPEITAAFIDAIKEGKVTFDADQEQAKLPAEKKRSIWESIKGLMPSRRVLAIGGAVVLAAGCAIATAGLCGYGPAGQYLNPDKYKRRQEANSKQEQIGGEKTESDQQDETTKQEDTTTDKTEKDEKKPKESPEEQQKRKDKQEQERVEFLKKQLQKQQDEQQQMSNNYAQMEKQIKEFEDKIAKANENLQKANENLQKLNEEKEKLEKNASATSEAQQKEIQKQIDAANILKKEYEEKISQYSADMQKQGQAIWEKKQQALLAQKKQVIQGLPKMGPGNLPAASYIEREVQKNLKYIPSLFSDYLSIGDVKKLCMDAADGTFAPGMAGLNTNQKVNDAYLAAFQELNRNCAILGSDGIIGDFALGLTSDAGQEYKKKFIVIEKIVTQAAKESDEINVTKLMSDMLQEWMARDGKVSTSIFG